MTTPTLCVVTIHGIGFEQPPGEGVPGYADDLHSHLSLSLGPLLSDDPNRQNYQTGGSVPIYVQSSYPLGSNCREAGMERLGKWDIDQFRTIDSTGKPLIKDGSSIAHVALVYSQLEGKGSQTGSVLITGGMALTSITEGHYASVTGLLGMLFQDTEPFWSHIFQHGVQNHTEAPTSLRVRQDEGFQPPKAKTPARPGGLMTVLRQLENDVAAYICHNDEREQIRGFVLDALLRIACRDDVSGIVINAHSNGTVVALDVLRSLPPFAAQKIRAFITAGSPLRKYITLFTWGQHVATVPVIATWWNFYDEKDPVADRLTPGFDWQRGTPPTPAQLTPSLFRTLDPNTGDVKDMLIKDISVDNLHNSSGGGLQAHNYWDNEQDFIEPISTLLKDLVQQAQEQPQNQ